MGLLLLSIACSLVTIGPFGRRQCHVAADSLPSRKVPWCHLSLRCNPYSGLRFPVRHTSMTVGGDLRNGSIAETFEM